MPQTKFAMLGLEIIQRTLSTPDRGCQYRPRGDRHSKVACWAVLFDLMRHCRLLRDHVAAGEICFGINHDITDYKQDRTKNLDLVLCIPGRATHRSSKLDFASYAVQRGFQLSREDRRELDALPPLHCAPASQVRVAMEAKACMTAHMKALPRLFDELNSSHQTVHGASAQTIAGGFVMINQASAFINPDEKFECPECGRTVSPVNRHRQPADAAAVIAKIHQLPRRANTRDDGFDAIGIVCVECRNDGSLVKIATAPPAPGPNSPYYYDDMVLRLKSLYESRFP